MDLPFSEWSRKQKDEFAKKRMEEMKLKNERYKERYAEVQQDRLKAEEKNSSITSGKVQKKEKNTIVPQRMEREWDKGKSNPETDDWNPPKFHSKVGYEFGSRGTRRNHTDRRMRKDENYKREQRSSFFSRFDSFSKFHKNESIQGTGIIRNENANNYRGRSRPRGNKYDGLRSYGNSKLDEPRKKIFEVCSASPNYSDSEMAPVKRSFKSIPNRMIWFDGGFDEIVHKQIRVEKWVKSLNALQVSDDIKITKSEFLAQDKKKEVGPHQEKIRKYGLKEDSSGKKIHASREQTQLRSKDKSDHKNNQCTYTNVQSRGNRNSIDNKVFSCSDAKNDRNIKRNNLNSKNRQRRESDMSDRSSSMKESDYRDWEKDKFNRATSDSKSSDYSAIWEDEAEGEYVSEQKSYLKSPNYRNCNKNKFNKSKSLKSTEDCKEKKIENVKDGHLKYRRRSRDKDNYLSKNLSSSDYENAECNGQSNRKPPMRKSSRTYGQNKFQKPKTELKLESQHGRLKVNCQETFAQNNDPLRDQNEKKCFSKTVDRNFNESSNDKEPSISYNDTWNNCDPNKNQHNQSATCAPSLESTSSDLPKTKIEDFSNVLWADYIASEETEECLSVDSVKRNNTMIEQSFDTKYPEVKPAGFEISISPDVSDKNINSDRKYNTELSDVSLHTKEKELYVIKTGNCDSYASDSVTAIVETVAENSYTGEILEKSESRICKIITCEKFKEQNANYDNEQYNIMHSPDPDFTESKENIQVVVEFSVLNKKQMSSDTLEKLNVHEVNRDTLSDDAGWSTVSDEEGANEGLDA